MTLNQQNSDEVRSEVWPMRPVAIRRARCTDGTKWRWQVIDDLQIVGQGRTVWRWTARRAAKRVIKRHLRTKAWYLRHTPDGR